jgi:hypothetical protein
MVRRATPRDRRLNARYLAYLPIEIHRLKRGSREEKDYSAFCIDISASGIRFATSELFHLGERLELTLGAPGGGDELTCEAEVVRIARVPQHYEIAAKVVQVVADVRPSKPAGAENKA